MKEPVNRKRKAEGDLVYDLTGRRKINVESIACPDENKMYFEYQNDNLQKLTVK